MLPNSKIKIKSRRFFKETAEKAKLFWEQNEREIILAIGVSLAVFIAFGAGILVGNNKPKESPAIEEPAVAEEISSLRENLKIFNESAPEITKPRENFVASKNGEYYYPLDCAAAGRIKDANKIFFPSKEAAEQKSYKPSGYCKF